MFIQCANICTLKRKSSLGGFTRCYLCISSVSTLFHDRPAIHTDFHVLTYCCSSLKQVSLPLWVPSAQSLTWQSVHRLLLLDSFFFFAHTRILDFLGTHNSTQLSLTKTCSLFIKALTHPFVLCLYVCGSPPGGPVTALKGEKIIRQWAQAVLFSSPGIAFLSRPHTSLSKKSCFPLKNSVTMCFYVIHWNVLT